MGELLRSASLASLSVTLPELGHVPGFREDLAE
jgi:hypothetical protein